MSAARIVTGSTAATAADSINARAFTVGNKVVFNESQYAPGSSGGDDLLAHELTHVAQQRGAAIPSASSLEIASPDSAVEREARANAPGSATGRAVIARDPFKWKNTQWVQVWGEKLKLDMMGQMNRFALRHNSAFLLFKDFSKFKASFHGIVTDQPLTFGALTKYLGFDKVNRALNRGRKMVHTESQDYTGSPAYSSHPAQELAGFLGPEIQRSINRIVPRYLKVRNQLALEAEKTKCLLRAPEVHPGRIIPSHPIDKYAIKALCAGTVDFDFTAYRKANPSEAHPQEIPTLRNVTTAWVTKGKPDGRYAWCRVTSPTNPLPTREEVANTLLGDPALAVNIVPGGQLFGFRPAELLPKHRTAYEAATGVKSVPLFDTGLMTNDDQATATDFLDEADKDEVMLGQSNRLAATGASSAEVRSRMDTCVTQLDGIIATASTYPVLFKPDGARSRLLARIKKLEPAEGEDKAAEAMKWDAQSSAQYTTLKLVASGIAYAIQQFKTFKFDPSKPQTAHKPLIKLAGAWLKAADRSDMAETAQMLVSEAQQRQKTFPIDMMEHILVYVRDQLEVAKQKKSADVDTDEFIKLEEKLRKKLIEQRAKLLTDPAAAQKEIDAMFKEVQSLQNMATISAQVANITQLVDTLEESKSWIGGIVGKNKLYDKLIDTNLKIWRRNWMLAYKQLRNPLTQEEGKKTLQKCIDAAPRMQADFQFIIKSVTKLEKAERTLKILASIAAAIAIIVVTMGIGTMVSEGLLVGAGWGATAGGVAAATVVTAGAEAATFSVLSWAIFEENKTVGGLVGSFFENWALFGAMRFIALGAELAALKTELKLAGLLGEGAKGAKVAGALVKGGGHAINIVGIFAYNLHKAEKESIAKTGQGLTAEQREQVLLEGFVVLLGVVLAARYGGKFFENMKLRGADAAWAKKIPAFGPRRQAMVNFASKMKSAKGIRPAEAEKLIARALQEDAALLKDQSALIREIAAWAKANPGKARVMGLDSAALGKQADALDTAHTANQRTQLARQLEPAGGDLFLYRGAEPLADFAGRFKKLNSDVTFKKSASGADIATIKPKDGSPSMRIQKPLETGKATSAQSRVAEPSRVGTDGPPIDTSATGATNTAIERRTTGEISRDNNTLWEEKAPDGKTTFREWYKKWMEQSVRVEKQGDTWRPKLPAGTPEKFKPHFERIAKEQAMGAARQGELNLAKLEAEGITLGKVDPTSPEYLRIRPKLMEILGPEGVAKYEQTMTEPAGKRVTGKLDKLLAEGELAGFKQAFGDCQIIVRGRVHGPGAAKDIPALEVTIVAPEGAPLKSRLAMQARADSMRLKTKPEVVKAGGKAEIPVKARVLTPAEYFGERTSGAGPKAEARIDDNFRKPGSDALGERFEAVKDQVDPETGELSPEVTDLMLRDHPTIKVKGKSPIAGVKAYVESLFPGSTITVEPLGGGKSGAKIFKVTIDGEMHVFKLFRSKTEMAREFAALKRVRDAKLSKMEAVGISDAANVNVTGRGGGPTGGALMKGAKGEFVKDTLDGIGKAEGGARAEAVETMIARVKKVAVAMAEMHAKMSSGRKVEGSYKAEEVKWLRKRWEGIRESKKVADAAAIETQLEALATRFEAAKLDATVAHGDAHIGNFAVGKSGKVQMIDAETMYRSVGTDGKGTGSAAIDVGRFMESIRTFGTEKAISPAEIARIQKAYIDTYRAAAKGAASGGDFATALEFYRANLDTIALNGAIRSKNRAGIAQHTESLKSTLGMESKHSVPADAATVAPDAIKAFEEWLQTTKLDSRSRKDARLKANLRDLWGKDPKLAIETAKKMYDYPSASPAAAPPTGPKPQPTPAELESAARRMFDYLKKADPDYTGKFSEADFVRKYVHENAVYDPVLRAWRTLGTKAKSPPGRFDPDGGWTRQRVFEVLAGKRAKPKFREPGKPEPANEFDQSFPAFRKLLHKLGVSDARIKTEIDNVGWKNETTDHVRHEVKLKFRDLIGEKLSDPGRAKLRAKWGGDYDWKSKPNESYDAARRRYANDMLEPLHQSDKGNLMEAVVRLIDMPSASSHVRMTKAEMAKHGVTLGADNRYIDLVDPASQRSREVKSGRVSSGELARIRENASVVRQKAPTTVDGKKVVVKQHEFQLTSPAEAKARRSDLVDLLRDYPNELTVVVQNSKGEVAKITQNGRGSTHDLSFLAKSRFETWLDVK